jgi:hypothetical protein
MKSLRSTRWPAISTECGMVLCQSLPPPHWAPKDTSVLGVPVALV